MLLSTKAPHIKPYERGVYPIGINLFGYLKAQMGLGQGARLYAKAISASGIPHILINTTVGNPSSHNDTEWEGRFSPLAKYNVNIIHVNAEQIPMIYSSYPSSTWNKRYNIGVWLWELECFPEEWKPSLQYVNEIWTPSTFTSRAVENATTLPVVTIPYGIYADTDPLCTRDDYHLPQDQFLFLCMYDANSLMKRKNPIGSIDAFLKAFGKNNRDAGLVIKINNATEDELSILDKRVQGARNIHVIPEVMDKRNVNSLIRCCDALVSLHRSEGFGLVIAEAMYLGVPVIATGWSANTDFMTDLNSCPVNYKLIDVGQDYYMSHSGQRWAEPDTDHAAECMKKLRDNADYRKKIAAAGQQTIRTEFTMERSAEKIRRRLLEAGLI